MTGLSTGVNIATWTCWGAVGAVWGAGALLARRNSPPKEKEEGNDAASIAGFVVGIAVLATPDSFWRHLQVHLMPLRLAGLVVVLLAAVATVWSRLALGTMWSSAAIARQDHALRTSGPYAITRHPIYTWILAMLLGTALTQSLGRWAALFVMVSVILTVKIRTEERMLGVEFPAEYDRYRATVPALIPLPRRRRDDRGLAGSRSRRPVRPSRASRAGGEGPPPAAGGGRGPAQSCCGGDRRASRGVHGGQGVVGGAGRVVQSACSTGTSSASRARSSTGR